MPKSLEFLLALDNTAFNRALDAAQVKVASVGRKMADGIDPAINKMKALRASAANVTVAVAAMGGAAALGGIYAIGQALTAAVQKSGELDTAAFNMQSSLAAANRQFDVGSVESWEKRIQSLQKSLRVYSETELRQATAGTIDMTKRLGFSAEQMQKVIQVSGDLGSGKFGLAESVERVTAAMRGEAEASEALGLTLNETYVKGWYEANNATGKAWKDLTDLEKAQVRFNVLLEQAGPSLGKAAESTTQWGGQLKATTDSFGELQVAVGEAVTKNQFFVEGLKIAEQTFTEWTAAIKDHGPEVMEYAKQTALTLLAMGEAGLTALDYIFRGSQGIGGVFQKTAAFALDVAGGIFKIIQAGAALTDFLGITKNATDEWAISAEAAFAAADDLGAKADANFQQMQDGAPKIQAARDALQQYREQLEQIPSGSTDDIAKDINKAVDYTDDAAVAAAGYKKELVEVNGVWTEQLVEIEKVTDEVDDINKKLNDLDGKTIRVTVEEKIREARAAGGMIGSTALAMAGGGSVAMRNMLRGGHFPGFGGGDRRHVIAEDGEYMLDKFRVRDAGLDVVRAFHHGNYDYVVAVLQEKLGAIRRQYGGMIDSVVGPVRQYLSAGGQVVGGAAGGASGLSIGNITINYSGSGSRNDARAMVDMVLTELERRYRGGAS